MNDSMDDTSPVFWIGFPFWRHSSRWISGNYLERKAKINHRKIPLAMTSETTGEKHRIETKTFPSLIDSTPMWERHHIKRHRVNAFIQKPSWLHAYLITRHWFLEVKIEYEEDLLQKIFSKSSCHRIDTGFVWFCQSSHSPSMDWAWARYCESSVWTCNQFSGERIARSNHPVLEYQFWLVRTKTNRSWVCCHSHWFQSRFVQSSSDWSLLSEWISIENSILVSGSRDNKVIFWDTKSGQILKTIFIGRNLVRFFVVRGRDISTIASRVDYRC